MTRPGLQWQGDRIPGQQPQHYRGGEEHHHHCDQHPVAPVFDPLQFVGGVRPGRRQVSVLDVEKVTHMVEFGLAAFGGGAADEVRSVGGHARDKRIGICRPPGGSRLLDRVQIGDQVAAGSLFAAGCRRPLPVRRAARRSTGRGTAGRRRSDNRAGPFPGRAAPPASSAAATRAGWMLSLSSRDTSSVRVSSVAPASAPASTSTPMDNSTRNCHPRTVSRRSAQPAEHGTSPGRSAPRAPPRCHR